MRKRIYIPALLLLLAVLAVLLMRQKRADVVPHGAEAAESTGSVARVVAITPNTPKPTNQTQSFSPSPTGQLTTLNDREKTNEIRQYMESQNRPVEFYGEVVDQDGNPLSDAKITGRIHRIKVVVPAPWGDEDQYIPFEKTTDSNGKFEILGGTGTSLGLVITKDGYESEPRSQPNFGPSSGGFQNPVIFKMWSTNIHEKLITGGKDFEVVPDGRLYFINLTAGTISEQTGGDLKVWIRYTNQVTRGQLYAWSAGIEVINGGLLEEPQGAVMYVAPTEGYTNSFQLQQQIKGGQSGEIGDRSFYLMLKDGQEYGRMNINLFAPYGKLHPGLIRLSYALNPSGSRVLR